MVVREDGSKWACQSCLKGHRVSGCTHTDRELTLVPKKGRPVTQCQHCRQERKKRAAHHKCDCGEAEKPHHPKEKCIHLREAEERAKSGHHDEQPHADKDAAHLAAVAEEQGCCCPHGGQCTCASVCARKDSERSIDSVAPHGPAVQKPRLEPTRSDGSITVFANGHHKPVHRKNHAAHECGMPYKMPMSRANTDQGMSAARRSVDNLALDTSVSFSSNGTSFVALAGTPLSAKRRMSKSEHPSPKLSAVMSSSNHGDARLSHDFDALGPVRTGLSVDSAASDTVMFPPLDPMSGVVDNAYDPWSAFPSEDSGAFLNNNPFGAWATTFEGASIGQPALTAASSGTQSEIDDAPLMEDVYGFPMPSIQEDTRSYLAEAAASDGGNPNRRSLPPSFFGNTDFSLPSMGSEWQTSVAGLSETNQPKTKPGESNVNVHPSWTTSAIPNTNGMSRSGGLGPRTGRPPSHSIGPGNVPSDYLVQQLFPGIDINGSSLYNESNSPLAIDSPSLKRLATFPTSNPALTSANFARFDNSANAAFGTQSWEDGSIAVPADSFNSPYNLDEEFAKQDFANEWMAS